ncbi:MAG: CPBP family intramembrane metalloprotease [Planctomycetaceae bacterium]|nr:CPBP family intramembrane metalloprotease [Planctomycetaceae bacterium]
MGWRRHGGGSFVYFELKKYNEEFIERINAAKTKSKLDEVYKKVMQQHKPVIILFYSLLAVSCWYYFAFPKAFPVVSWNVRFWTGCVPLLSALFLFGLVPMCIVKFVFRERLADYGLRLGIRYRTVRSFCLAAPFVILAGYFTGYNPAFYDVYPLNYAVRTHGQPPGETIGLGIFTFHCVLYLGYYFGWEFLFRGFMQHGLSERCGLPAAVLMQTAASTMLHYGHPASEVFAAIAAGLVWGTFAYRTQSILSGFGQHALLGIVLDYVLIYA